MLLLAFLICASPSVLGQLEESLSEDDADSELADFDLDIVRNVKTKPLDFPMSGFLSLMIFVPTGAAQGPPAGENYTVQGKVKFTADKYLKSRISWKITSCRKRLVIWHFALLQYSLNCNCIHIEN